MKVIPLNEMPKARGPRRSGHPSPRCAIRASAPSSLTYALAMMADNIEHVISYWMVFQKFHSPALGRLRRGVALAAVPAVLGRRRRARRPLRSAPPHPVRHGAVHRRLARLGLFLHHRHAADVARHGAAGDPRLRRRAVADPEPAAALRHRRPGRPAERGAPQRDRALSRRAGRPGGGRRDHADARAVARHPAQHAVLPAAGAVAGERALRSALPQGRAAAAARGARLRRHRADRARHRRAAASSSR